MRVIYYQSASGSQPVREYLDELSSLEEAFVQNALDDVMAHGFAAPTVRTRHIDGKLWELKVSAQRVFYVVVTGSTMVLLHAYKKQSQKAPHREIEVALKRMKEVLHG